MQTGKKTSVGSPVKIEDGDDQHEGEDIGENPHQVVFFWTLTHTGKKC